MVETYGLKLLMCLMSHLLSFEVLVAYKVIVQDICLIQNFKT